MYADLAARSIFLTTGDDVQSVLARRLLLFTHPTMPAPTFTAFEKGLPASTAPPSPAASGTSTPYLNHAGKPARLAILTSGGDCSGMVRCWHSPGLSHAEQLLPQNAAVRAVVKMGIARCVVHRFRVTRPRGSSTSSEGAVGSYRRAWELLWPTKSSCCGRQERSPLGRFPNDRALRDRGS